MTNPSLASLRALQALRERDAAALVPSGDVRTLHVPTDEEKANKRHYDNVANQLHLARSYAHKVDVLGNVFIKGAGLMGLYVAASKAASWLKGRRKEMK